MMQNPKSRPAANPPQRLCSGAASDPHTSCSHAGCSKPKPLALQRCSTQSANPRVSYRHWVQQTLRTDFAVLQHPKGRRNNSVPLTFNGAKPEGPMQQTPHQQCSGAEPKAAKPPCWLCGDAAPRGVASQRPTAAPAAANSSRWLCDAPQPKTQCNKPAPLALQWCEMQRADPQVPYTHGGRSKLFPVALQRCKTQRADATKPPPWHRSRAKPTAQHSKPKPSPLQRCSSQRAEPRAPHRHGGRRKHTALALQWCKTQRADATNPNHWLCSSGWRDGSTWGRWRPPEPHIHGAANGPASALWGRIAPAVLMSPFRPPQRAAPAAQLSHWDPRLFGMGTHLGPALIFGWPLPALKGPQQPPMAPDGPQ